MSARTDSRDERKTERRENRRKDSDPKKYSMKKLFSLLVLLPIAITCFSQVEDPVSWTFSAKKIDATTYELHLTAKLEDGWHIYSQTTPQGGPAPTEIAFNKNPLLTLDGATKEIGKMEQRLEVLFGVDVKQFSGKVDFVQVVKRKVNAKTNITGSIKFMTCNDEMCLPPKSLPFTIMVQ
jgi:hypothetical protein